jgi:arylsulfatase A-like enzyme
MVTRLDWQVGEIIGLLKALDLDRNTIVIFSGDNGPQGVDEGNYNAAFFNSTGGLRGLKRSVYEGGIREPMIIRWPEMIKPGTVSDAVWSHYDLFPTFAQIAKTSTPAGLDGISVLPVWINKKESRPRPLYWEFHEGGFMQAVRLGNWKGVRHGLNGKIELYDLATDAAETKDLAGSNPKFANKMLEIMKREHRESPLWRDQ